MAFHRCVTVVLVFAGVAATAHAEDKKIFSGPQVGEKLPPLKVKGVYGKDLLVPGMIEGVAAPE